MFDSFLTTGTDLNSAGNFLFLLLILLWVLPWKMVAVWKAARNHHKKWFIVLFLLNTLAILEIVYIFYFSKKSPHQNPKGEQVPYGAGKFGTGQAKDINEIR